LEGEIEPCAQLREYQGKKPYSHDALWLLASRQFKQGTTISIKPIPPGTGWCNRPSRWAATASNGGRQVTIYVLVNNRSEGNAPLTVQGLSEMLRNSLAVLIEVPSLINPSP